MDVEETREHIAELRRRIEVEEAFCAGKAIEYRRHSTDAWMRLASADWNWDGGDYRVAPEPPKPTYRPFANRAEARPYRDQWLMSDGESEFRVDEFDSDGIYCSSGEFVSYRDAVDNLRFVDTGLPFGVEVTE